jgi:hypothetical protein
MKMSAIVTNAEAAWNADHTPLKENQIAVIGFCIVNSRRHINDVIATDREVKQNYFTPGGDRYGKGKYLKDGCSIAC